MIRNETVRPGAVEHIVGRDVHQRKPPGGGGTGHRGRRCAIHHGRLGLLILGRIDGGPGSGIDDRIAIRGRDRCGAGLRVAQVGLFAPQEARVGHETLQLRRDLPCLAENQ